MLNEQTVINECYILQSRLGEDSFTEHWAATAIFSAKKFLLRFLKGDIDSALAELLRESAMRSYRVQGSTIADIVEFESYGDRAFISSEYRVGGDLAAYERSGKRMKIEDVCAVLLALSRGLSVFHDQGVIYGNLNPEQVLVGPRGSFSTSTRIQKPSMHALVGTIPAGDARVAANYAYVSRECKAGKTPTVPDDVYSLGVHLVRMLTGKLPFPDDEAALRTNGASLTFAANALLRRGIWTDLVAIALRCLIEDSPSGYRTCAEFVDDLRAFMESERILTGTREDYFRQANAGAGRETTTEYPSLPHGDAGAVERIERGELIADTREKGWTVDDYLRSGIKTIAADRSGELFGVPVPPASAARPVPYALPARPEPADARWPAAAPIPAPPVSERHVPPPPVTAKTVMPAVETVIVQKHATLKSATVKSAVIQPVAKKDAKKKRAAGLSGAERVAWNYHRIQYDDVVKIFEISVARAKKGFGSFRFVQEPESVTLSSRLYHALEKINADATYANVGSLEQYGTADIGDFLSMTRVALSRAVSVDSAESRRNLAEKVRLLDEYGIFASAPTGKLLYGKDGSEIDQSVLDTVPCQESVARSLFAFGKKRRPLIIVVRHGECATRELDVFLNRLARGISAYPACVIVFFTEGNIASWHSLSSINRLKFETGEAIRDS